MPALVENDDDGAASLAGGERNRTSPGTLRQRSRRVFHALRHRVHPAQARPDREAAVSLAGHEARVPAPVETHLCPDRVAGDQGSAKGLAVARTRAHADEGNVHAGGSIGEAGSPRIDDAPEIALGAV